MTVTCSNPSNRIAVRYADRAACTRSNFNAFGFTCVAGKWSLNTASGLRPVSEIYCDGVEGRNDSFRMLLACLSREPHFA